MPSTVATKNGACNEQANNKDGSAQRNVEKLHRMVLGKDENIDNDYVENFYVGMASEVTVQSTTNFVFK